MIADTNKSIWTWSMLKGGYSRGKPFGLLEETTKRHGASLKGKVRLRNIEMEISSGEENRSKVGGK